MKLRELIKRVRGCKTSEEERSIINKESAEMRNMKDQNSQIKCRNLTKCIFIHMLGFETNFIQMTCVDLLSSSNFTHKRIAYVALCVLMDERCEVLLLTTSTIKKDLESTNQYITAIALNAIGEVCTPFMCRELAPDIIKLLNHQNPYIKKKAALACSKVIRKCPEFLETISDKLGPFFEEKNHGALLCGLSLAIQVFKLDESYVEKYKKYLKTMIKYLKNLVSTNYAPEYDINGITDPFLQVKILEVMQFFGKENDESAEEMNNLLANISTNTDSSKATGNAVLYELVRTIIKIEGNPGLKTLGSNILGKFLAHKDNNYKYIALNTLQEVAKTDLNSVQKHKATILECLKDNDVSVKRRALDLTYVIINQSNIKQIVKECLNFLLVAENEFKLELTTKITQSMEKYSPSIKWQIDTLIKMLSLSANYVSDESISSIINLIISTPELQLYSIHKLFIAMQNNLGQEALIKVGIYILGEFSPMLILNPATGPDGEQIVVSESSVIELIQEINSRKFSNSNVKEYILNCLVKLSTKLQNSMNEIRKMIDLEKTSYFAEVQQRAVEYSVFNDHSNFQLRQKITENVPSIKINEEQEKRAIVDNEEEEDSDIKLSNNMMGRGKHIVNSMNTGNHTSSGKTNTTTQQTNFFDDLLTSGSLGITQNPIAQSQGGNLISGLDDIFGGNKITNTITNNQNLSGMDSIFGNFGGQTIQPTQSKITNDYGGIDFLGNMSSTPEPKKAEKLIHTGADVQISYSQNKVNDSEMNISYYLTNSNGNKLTNVNLKILAPPHLNTTVINTSGSMLTPNQKNGIQKDIKIVVVDSSKPLKIKLVLSYNGSSGEISESLVQSDFS